MDVSEKKQPGGEELIQQLVALTELPPNLVHDEINQILKMAGQDSGSLTLEQLREAMIAYLETLGEGVLGAESAD